MRNSILIGIMLSCAILGGVIGGNIQSMRDQADIEQAWDNITVVADGTLVPNPSAYAYNPDELAKASNVRIIDNSRAAISVAMNDRY